MKISDFLEFVPEMWDIGKQSTMSSREFSRIEMSIPKLYVREADAVVVCISYQDDDVEKEIDKALLWRKMIQMKYEE